MNNTTNTSTNTSTTTSTNTGRNITRPVGQRERDGQITRVSYRRRSSRRFVGSAGLSMIALLALTSCSVKIDGGTSDATATSVGRVTTSAPGASTSAPGASTSAPGAPTSVTEVDCDFEGIQLTVAPPTCYAVTVPQDWSSPAPGDSVVLKAAVFQATNPDAAASDPVIYLQGGPGLGSLGAITLLEPAVVEPFVSTRDVILFDQRGTGQSTPSLDCDTADEVTEYSIPDTSEVGVPTDSSQVSSPNDTTPNDAAATEEFDPNDPAMKAAEKEAMLKETAECHRQLTEAGVNLAAYNSIASAHDIDAIRAGLGYDRVNIVGISYGTRLAQTYMRMYPDSIRSVVIDSVLPVAQAWFEIAPVTLQQALQHLFDSCRADAGCNDAYPNFEADFWALVDRLNADPVDVEIHFTDGSTWTNSTTGNTVIGLAMSSLYRKSSFARFPEMVSQAMAGNYEVIGELYSANGDTVVPFSDNTTRSVECNERVPFESAERKQANMPTEGEFRRLADYYQQSNDSMDQMFETCPVWPAGTAPAVENEPVVSEIPTLVMTGSFDPVTPPSFARSVAEHLPNSTLVEFPTEGHMVMNVDCARDLARTFVDDPGRVPDASCVATVPPPQWVAS